MFSFKKLSGSILAMSLCLAPLCGADNQLSSKENSDGWQLLFDGTSLKENWRNFQQETIHPNWLIRDGMFGITEGGAGDIQTRQQYDNFEFKIDWKISEKGNSGIFFRTDEKGKKIYTNAIEIQILDDMGFRSKQGQPAGIKQRTGGIYDIKPAKDGLMKPAGQWNTTHIIAKDKHIQIFLNGQKAVEITLESEEWKKLIAESKFKKNPAFGLNSKGYIGLQDHRSEVWFKNAKVKPLN